MGGKPRRSIRERAEALAEQAGDGVLEVARALFERGDERSLLLAAHVAAAAQGTLNMSWDEIGAEDVLMPVFDAAIAAGFHRPARAVVDFFESEQVDPIASGLATFRELDLLCRLEGREPPQATAFALCHAAWRNDVADVELLLARGVGVDEPGMRGLTALDWACHSGGLESAAALLEAGASANGVTGSDAPLRSAVGARAAAIVRLLLEKGADPGDAVLTAAGAGDVATLEAFEAAGVDLRGQFGDHRSTPLHHAAGGFRDQVDAVRFLLERGAAVDRVDGIGWTPLETAANAGNPESAKALLDAGATASQMALQLAVSSDRSVAIVRALVAAGIDPTAIDEDGDTAMTSAVRLGCAAVVGALIELGVPSAEALAEHGNASLLFAAAERGELELLRALAAAGFPVDTPDAEGRTPLVRAAGAGEASLVQCLLDLGADPNQQSDRYHSPLAIAARENRPEVVELLLGAGAAVDRPSDGLTPLVHAVKHDAYDALAALIAAGADLEARDHERWPMVVLALLVDRPRSAMQLLEAGADIEARDQEQMRPLMAAAARGHDGVARWLIGAGADIESRDHDGATPLVYAAAGGCASTVELLLASGADPSAAKDDGATAADRAAHHGHRAIAARLRRAMRDQDR